MLRVRSIAAFLCIAFVLCLTGAHSVQAQSALRRVTNTTEEGINLNPSLSGDGRITAFETTEDVARAGGTNTFRAIRADVASDPPVFTQMGRMRAVTPAISQDGSRIAFAARENPLGSNQDGNSEIFLFDAGTLRQITNTSPGNTTDRIRNGNYQPSISDDGRFIAFSSNRDLVGLNADGNFEIFIYDALSQAFTQITNTIGTVGGTDAKISGNGLRVAFINDRGASASTQRDLVIQTLAGGATQIAASNVPGLALTYGRAISDDGSRVVFAADTAIANARQVFLFDGRSGNLVRPITFLGTRATGEVPLHPTISGDGSRIAFATRRAVSDAIGGANTDSSVELYTFDLPTSQFARVTPEVTTTDPATIPTREVVSSLNDQGTIIAFNFPRILSGPTLFPESANNSEIYVTATPARPAFGTLTVLNGASFGNEPSSNKAVAPNSVAVGIGGDLATSTEQSQRQQNGTFPTNVAGTTVRVNNRAAQIFFVSPIQVIFHVPPETELGTAEVVITNSNNFETRGTVTVLRAAPGVFTFTGNGTGEGVVLDADTLQPGPFDPSNGQRRLIVFATGVRNATQISVTIGGRFVTVEAVMPSPNMPGMDEIHLLLPADLRGAGSVEMVVRADGRDSNPVTVNISGDARRDVVINEVLADPPDGLNGDANRDGARDSNQDEFVEIVNATDSDVNVSGWELYARGGSGSNDTLRHRFAANTILPARGAIVVFGGGTFDLHNPAFGGAQVFTASTGSLSLVNANGVVTLKDTTGAVVNLLSYGGSTGINADENQSVTRSPDVTGAFTGHLSAAGSGGRAFSPGTHVDGSPFLSPAIARIEVSPATASIFVGQQQQYTARAFDSSGNVLSGVLFIWQSSNPAVATIDQNGNARGVAEGTTQITATARGVQSPPASLTVIFTPPVLTSIEVTPSQASIPIGGGQQFTATAFDQFHNPMAGVVFTWSSSAPNIATVDQTGLALGVSLGQTTITASAQNVSGTATLTVTPATVIINEVLADPPAGVPDGDANHDGVRDTSDDEFVELVNSTSSAINIAGWKIKTRPLTGSTTETTRHTFAAGTTLPAGDAIVVFGGGIIDATNPLFGGAQVVKASTAGLSLTNGGLTILVHDAADNLVTQVTYGGTTGLEGDEDQSLTRSPDITGGFVLHTAATGAGGRRFSPGTRVDGSPFVRRAGRLTSISISPSSANVFVGQTTQFTARALDQFGQTMTGINISFASSDTNVATIESVSTDPATGIATATVMGRNVGNAQITASATEGATTVTSSPATLSVTLAPPRVTRVEVAPAVATINRGGTQQFTATAFDPNNQVVPSATFTWTSSDPTIATVDGNGLATGTGIGTVTITASAPDGLGGTTSGQATLNVQIPLIINEILADPPGTAATDLQGDANRDGVRDGDDDEFVELVNNSNAPVDISNVVIADATNTRFTFPANTILAAGRAVIVFGGGTPPVNDPAFGGALIFTTSSLGLGNTGDTVTIRILLAGTNVVIDTKTYGAEGDNSQSLTRSPDITGAFVQHTAAANSDGRVFSPGTRVDGTPFGSPAITRIEVTPVAATINPNETQAFTGRAFSNVGGPEVEVQNVSFVWDSSDTGVATVAPLTGASTTATGHAGGNAAIRARAGGQQGTATLNVTGPLPANPGQVLISEFRTRGPNGADDEFIEIYNPTTSTVIIGGFLIRGSNSSGTIATRVTIAPADRTLGPGCYYLLTNTDFSGAAGDQTYSSGITNDGGIAITRADGTTIIDAVGMSAGSAYKEGTPLAPLPTNTNQSYERKPTSPFGNGVDTNDNNSDFVATVSNPQGSTSGCLDTSLADLSITKTDAPDPVQTGSDVTYTITVTNNGPGVAQNVSVTDNLPSELTFVSCNSTAGGVCGGTGNNRTVTFPSPLAIGSSATITIVATANGTGSATISNTATVASTNDPNAGNNSATTTTTATTLLDLSIVKTVNNATPNIGDNVTFTLTLSNNSTNAATGVQVTDQLPAGLTFVSASPAAEYNSGTGIWTVGTVNGGTNRVLTITATATASATNTATITALDQTDTNATNNQSSVTVTATAAIQADLTITKTDSPDPVPSGNNVTYTLTVTNGGPDAAQNVVVTDTLPANVTFVSCGSTGGGVCGGTATTPTVTFTSLGNGASATITLVATVNSSTGGGTTISNTASVTSDTFDPTTPNTVTQVTSINTIIINEALVASNNNTTRPDFLELYNTTGQTRDISGMVISFRPGGVGNVPSSVTIPAGTTMAANSYFIIVNGASTLNGSNVAVTADYNPGAGNFDLNGTGGGIKIELGGIKLDGLTYQGSATAINATFVAYGEGSIFTFTAATTNDLVRSSTSTDTNNNLNDFRHLSVTTTITPKAVNPP